MDEYRFNQLNECAFTILENTGTTGLVSEPQLELTHTAILSVRNLRIECHR